MSKFGWDPNEFTESETLSATLVLESSNEKENAANKVDATGVDASPDGSSTDSKATAADDKKSNDLVAVIEKKKDIFPLSLLHMDLKSTFTFSNGIEILKNVGSVACCLSKKIIALDKAAWIVFVG